MAQGAGAGKGAGRSDWVCGQRGPERALGRGAAQGSRSALEEVWPRGRRHVATMGGGRFCPGGGVRAQGQPTVALCRFAFTQAPGVLFRGGSDRHFHAVVTNQKIDGGRLLDWQREKAGTGEHTPGGVKNEVGGG